MRVVVLLLVLVGCGASPEAPRCELGRVQSCPCVGGGQGAQECGAVGVWGACACSPRDAAVGDAVADGGADAAADASTGDVVAVGDAVLVDGAVAPRLYRACDLGADCGAGLTCVAVPGLVRDAGAGRGVCTTSCATSAECAGRVPWRGRCVEGSCFIDCAGPAPDPETFCVPWGTRCQLSTVRIPETELPAGTPYGAYCSP
jgi:hypothetical protein